MDLVVRFFDDHEQTVKNFYLTSDFLQHATAVDLLAKFKEGIHFVLCLDNILQESI